ncbi:recombinase family protein [Streptomyces sp. HYC2]|uniref:recombinase family protein n=1 Tax=Streptomyces sp. HYC2 TaxID=2955207 RepID=UPI002480298E|nr:recombinase family protein [Streptomyces sp. HYC2]
MRLGAGLVAREYRRLSDRKGGTSIKRQGSDNRAAADEMEWTLGEPYIDDGLSASRFARKGRDDFEQLVADLKSGPTGSESRFAAHVLMLWESSRGSRQVGEWVSFIELCEAKKVRIWVTTHERLYDPANGRDRKALIDDAVDSEYESYKIHRRVIGTAAEDARDGRPYGEAPYGLMAVYDSTTGKLVDWVEDPGRSKPVKELFRLLEKGESLAEIQRKFVEADYRNKSGKHFSRAHLRIMAMRHSYTGLRYHKGDVYEGIWKGIIPRKRFWTVQTILTDPARVTYRGGGVKHELTAALTCGKCASPFRAYERKAASQWAYQCRNDCMHIPKDPVDDFIIGTPEEPGYMMEYLARDDIYDLLAAPEEDDPEVQQVRTELAAERAELKKMERAEPDTLEAVQVLGRSIRKKRLRVRELEDRERELTLPPVVLNMIRPGVDVWETWNEAPISARRQIARIVLSPRCLGQAVVLPAARTGPNQDVTGRLDFRKAPPPPAADGGQGSAAVE